MLNIPNIANNLICILIYIMTKILVILLLEKVLNTLLVHNTQLLLFINYNAISIKTI